jgi:hypothetical protein
MRRFRAFPDWGSPDPLDSEVLPDELLCFGFSSPTAGG